MSSLINRVIDDTVNNRFDKLSGIDGISGAAPSASTMNQFDSNFLNTYFRNVRFPDPSTFNLGDIGSGNSGNNVLPATPQQIDYIDAPYAEAYGMSASTAYHEALANTAHQREVADLRAAGLNPVLGISGSGASSFGGVVHNSGSVGSGLSASKNDISALPYLVSGIVGLVSGKSTAANSAFNLVSGISKLFGD